MAASAFNDPGARAQGGDSVSDRTDLVVRCVPNAGAPSASCPLTGRGRPLEHDRVRDDGAPGWKGSNR